jgi:GTP-binding protein EngB required for normal cell division/uncharacterized protein (DUF697 family)
MSDTKDNQEVRQEVQQIQKELQEALQILKTEAGKKLSEKDRQEIESEFQEIDQILEILKGGLVHVALFGKTSVGKSAIVNSLMGADMAKVGVEMDLSRNAVSYRKDPWLIIDMPGILGQSNLEKMALDEAKKAHGLIFVIDGEPYQDELECFEAIHSKIPMVPKIVFVNQWDKVQMRPTAERVEIKKLIYSKMRCFVQGDDDIVYGSAQLFNPETDSYHRQEIPALVARMYENAGTLGMVMNLLDPARQASDLASGIREKIMGVKVRLARKVISAFATAEAVVGLIPLSEVITAPGLLVGLTYTLMKILGVKDEREAAIKIAKELFWSCAKFLAVDFGASVAISIAGGASFLLGPIAWLTSFGILGAAGYYRYRRTVIFGEVALEYIKNDCSWGGEDPETVIKMCRERALAHYMKLKVSMDA